mgnify:CR=1 FL=1
MTERPNYYAILSAEVRYDNRLKPNVKLLYAEITALCNMNKECYASNKYFSDLYNKSKGTISGWISELVKYNYIKVSYTYKQGTKEIDNRYIIISKGAIPNLSNGVCDKNLKSNNIKDNTNTTYSNIKGRFKKPSISDVKDYCLERDNNIDAEAFIDFYKSKDWKIGKSSMKCWKSCVRTWERRQEKKGMSKIHQHLQKNLNVKEKLKEQFKK